LLACGIGARVPAAFAPSGRRVPMTCVLGTIWRRGLSLSLQGVGFAVISAFASLFFASRGWSHAALAMTFFGGAYAFMRVCFGHLPDRIGGYLVAVASLGIEGIGQALLGRVAKAVLISAVPPVMVKSEKNPDGLPVEVFDKIREGTAKNRAQFYQDITLPFYGYNRPGSAISQGIRDNWWRQGRMGGIKAQYDCIKAFSETDFTENLKQIDVPTFVMHGEDDQIVPFADAGPLSAKLLKNAQTKFYPGFPHGMPTTHGDVINADLLEFMRS
jgi:hypothetical protein